MWPMAGVNVSAQLGSEIRRQREAAGYSPEGFAAKVGIRTSCYLAIEHGVGAIYLSTVERVARGLGVRVSELMRGAGL
jgi:transcriptional regulator with XRE-family HTH domain